MNQRIFKRATFRFYEELNDFLPPPRRKVSFYYQFEGNPSVKDAIEAIGVPHVEVDLILANCKSVPFSYKLKDGDRISVYPAFESLDISSISKLRKNPLRSPKFILDVHLGKLARRLRMLGFDTAYSNNFKDEEIINIAENEKRIILTRDIQILKNGKVTRGYWVRETSPQKQIIEVIKRFDLINLVNPFSRCIECNSILSPVAKESIIHLLPANVKKNFNDFSKCTGCEKIYWQGTHFEKMRKQLEKIKTLMFEETLQ